MKTKLLLYCTKAKPYLFKKWTRDLAFWQEKDIDVEDTLNGKIVAECECEVEEIEKYIHYEPAVDIGLGTLTEFEQYAYETETLSHFKLMENACLDEEQMDTYFNQKVVDKPIKVGYALHLTNIKVFEKPLTIEALYQPIDNNFCKGCKEYNTCEYAKSKNKPCKKVLLYAPQNMCWVWYNGQKYCLISIRPEWLCKILNGEKTIEVRRKILKGMM